MLDNIKSKYVLKQIFKYVDDCVYLKLILYNQKLKDKLRITKDSYEIFSKIEIEIEPKPPLERNKIQGKNNTRYKLWNESKYPFININKNEESYFHIYLYEGGNKKEIHRTYLKIEENVRKIKIIIDRQVKSLKRLFSDCFIITTIRFIYFKRKNITDMSYMFNGCESLINLNISELKTNKVSNMEHMFSKCLFLKNLNVSHFITNNVTNMEEMFSDCSSLKKLSLLNFNTKNVTNMGSLFSGCSKLNELDISNFDTRNVTNMAFMFE